jgi:hypothetical protein
VNRDVNGLRVKGVLMCKIFVAALGLILVSSPARSQQQVGSPKTAPAEVRLDATKPTTYLRFERYDAEDVWLRLHNNSRWAVSIRTEESFHIHEPSKWGGRRDALGLLEGVEVSPAYEIERYPHEQSVYHNGCTFSESWIPSGRSILFKVTRAPLTYPATLRVNFRYEWELDDEPEPGHYVHFSGHELPRSEP